ncbi:MAG: AAA family ATPase, partial [Proteobacteria bacterium]|nr:AAA family ATPase [Pseudomonadota bacterium]
MAHKFPIGIQTFERLRNDGYIYVDKTELVYRLAHGSTFNFLARPRRFGKSLLVSTLQAYFEGKKDLFTGLAMEKLETEWIQYPVLHLDL